MIKTTLLRGAKQLVTLFGSGTPRRGVQMRDLYVIQDGAVLIQDGRITAVGSSRRLEKLEEARQADELDATGKVVMPGFVDCHTKLLSGPPQFGALKEDPLAAMKAVRASTTQRLELEARRTLRQFLRHGTTTLETKTGYGLDEATELRSLRVLNGLDEKPLSVVTSFFGAHLCPPEYDDDCRRYLNWTVEKMLPMISRKRLARFVDAECGAGRFSADDCILYLTAARQMGFPVRVHSGMQSDESVRVAIETGAGSIDKVRRISVDAARALAASGTMAVLLPGEAFHMGVDYPPGRELIDEGVAVALASGHDAGTSPSCSMPAVVSIACCQMKMTAEEAITSSTINAAYALGVDGRAGSIEVGKDADLLLLNASDYREIPFYFGINPVAMVMRRGEILYPRLGSS
ncbi:MAG: amidohydrolase family protein [Acidobacteriia bacterium]|nr:amidohydrolase family protein [Terriglobia bacterium]